MNWREATLTDLHFADDIASLAVEKHLGLLIIVFISSSCILQRSNYYIILKTKEKPISFGIIYSY